MTFHDEEGHSEESRASNSAPWARRGAVVLCGGGSRRMGSDKAWLPFGGGETMLQRVVRLLRESVPGEQIAVVAGVEQPLPPLPADTMLLRDEQPGGGPLPAIAQGLAALTARVEMAFATTCDAPLIRPALVDAIFGELESARAAERGGAQVRAAAPRNAERCYPLAAAYHVSMEPVARGLLQQGATALHQLLDAATVRWIDAERLRSADPELASLFNCNTPEQYQAALRRLESERLDS